MIETNGSSRHLPTLKLTWDAQAQAVGVHFDPAEFKSFEFLLMLVDGAKRRLEDMRHMAQAQQMQQAAMQAQQDEILRQRLLRG